MLLEKNSDVNAPTKLGDTALMLAALYGQTETVNLLLSRDAKIEARDSNGLTALMMAADGGHSEVVQALIAHGANVHAETRDGISAPWRSHKRKVTAKSSTSCAKPARTSGRVSAVALPLKSGTGDRNTPGRYAPSFFCRFWRSC